MYCAKGDICWDALLKRHCNWVLCKTTLTHLPFPAERSAQNVWWLASFFSKNRLLSPGRETQLTSKQPTYYKSVYISPCVRLASLHCLMNHFHVLFDFLQLKLFECHFSSSFLNITDSRDLLFWFQRVVCSVTVYWSVNLTDESDYNQVSCINTFFTVLELDLMWWRCTTAVWFSSIVVFSFGCYLICTVFVVCVCVCVRCDDVNVWGDSGRPWLPPQWFAVISLFLLFE